MLQAMLAGSASIRAHQQRMNVIGNNLANINTTAFRASRLHFMDLMSHTLRGAQAPNGGRGGLNPLQVGTGVAVAGVSIDPSTGSIVATNRPTDLALNGSGYFVVGSGEGQFFTRDGGFELDSLGNIVHRSTGHILQGWGANGTGSVDVTGTIGNLRIPTGATSQARSTSEVNLGGNLAANTDADTEFRTTFTVFDSLGNAREVTVRFLGRDTDPVGGPEGAASSWNWEVLDGTTVLANSGDAGPLYFNASGQPVGGSAFTFGLPQQNGAGTQEITLNMGGLSQLAQGGSVRLASQDGYGPGTLTSFTIVPDGTVMGIFSNGQTQALGRVATAVFANPAGMQQLGGNLWSGSPNSGAAIIGAPGESGQPAVYAGYLETSNVDLGSEFTDMIVTQRGYQANTRVITTADEMMQEILAIKR